MRNKGYKHEITFNNDSIQYVVSTTFYINKEDREYLAEIGVDFTTIKTVSSYKLWKK